MPHPAPKDTLEFLLGEIHANTEHTKEALDKLIQSHEGHHKRITKLEHDQTKRKAIVALIALVVSTAGVTAWEYFKGLLHGRT